MTHEYQIERFVDAQSATYETAIHQLRRRVLDPAWMAFVFPRFVNCYHDPSTETFAIGSLDEARAYLAHPLLGSRLRESLTALAWLHDLDPDDVLSERDRQNLHSSLALFAEATNEPLMRQMLANLVRLPRRRDDDDPAGFASVIGTTSARQVMAYAESTSMTQGSAAQMKSGRSRLYLSAPFLPPKHGPGVCHGLGA